MKIAVINFSGNVGKSTIARHVLAPRIPGAEIIAIETINSDGTDDEALKGKQFGQLVDGLALMDAAVVDIGASNVEDVVQLMKQYKGSHEDFDYFVVPTVPAKKQQRDTISTINALAELGVPAKKIRLVFNQVEPDDNPATVFDALHAYHAAEKRFTLRDDAVLRTNDIYTRLNGQAVSLSDILNDPTDYKEKLKTSTNVEEKLNFANLLSMKRLAAGVVEEHDAVFKALFK